MLRRLYLLLQHTLPHHTITRLGYWITRIRWRPVKNWQIRGFVKRFRIDMAEAESADLNHYPTFDAFFTRALKPGARTPDPDPAAVLMPADGRISATGRIQADRIYQAKNRSFSLAALLGDESRVADYADGSFATVYLQPRNYHRVHLPFAGTLLETLYIPGRLYSVAPVTVDGVQRLFARNERLVCHFDTTIGPMALILVGAMIVSGIETVWSGMETEHADGLPERKDYRSASPAITLDRFAEAGRFHMGSTAIVLFGRDRVAIEPFDRGQTVCVGQRLGTVIDNTKRP
jgi:phosphatidylserine decarboxylase